MTPDEIELQKILQHTARNAARQPRFLASAFEKYREVEKLNEPGLAAYLEIADVATLTRLALCLRPVPDTPRFRADVEQICQKFGVAPAKLVSLLRRVAAYETTSAPASGFLMAARDYEPDAGGEPNESK